MNTPRTVLLSLVDTLTDWDLDDYGRLLENCAQRAIPPAAVLFATALAIKRGEGIKEVRTALDAKPWTRKDNP